MDRIVVVSGDGHMSAPLDAYKPSLEERYHGVLDRSTGAR